MIDIIYKTVKPLLMKKLQIIQNVNNLMFQVTFIFSNSNFDKANHNFLYPFCLRWDDKNFGESF